MKQCRGKFTRGRRYPAPAPAYCDLHIQTHTHSTSSPNLGHESKGTRMAMYRRSRGSSGCFYHKKIRVSKHKLSIFNALSGLLAEGHARLLAARLVIYKSRSSIGSEIGEANVLHLRSSNVTCSCISSVFGFREAQVLENCANARPSLSRLPTSPTAVCLFSTTDCPLPSTTTFAYARHFLLSPALSTNGHDASQVVRFIKLVVL